MKIVKLISLAFFILNCFIATAQEKRISKEHSVKDSLDTKTVPQSFSKSKDTNAKVSSDAAKPAIPNNQVIICAPSKNSLLNAPLTIVDGVIINSKQFSEINPKDIESIKVLKGADATPLYGNQAINGVIIITTKK